jgi:hypothetical protein
MMRSPIDPFTPAAQLAAAIRRKEVSPVEVADCYLERMDKLDPRLNAFCHRADDEVRNAASAAAEAVVRAASAEDPLAVLKHRDEDAIGRGGRQEVEDDGLERVDDGAKGDQQQQECQRDDEAEDERDVRADGVVARAAR